MYSFPNFEPVHCSMSGSNCCFLTCIQVSQEAGKVVWYSHLFQNFPQFVVTHTVKGFSMVSKAEIDVFLELFCFFDDPTDVGNLISGSSAFFEPSLYIWKWNTWSYVVIWIFFGIAFLWDWNENWPFLALWPLSSFPNSLAYWVQHFHSIIFWDLK